ncbi:MAG: hypothetical protein CL920_00255 [Deltaproteobacteria bacterium]|nr:hypothetical protein [Deltaproteobacteria bacterium]
MNLRTFRTCVVTCLAIWFVTAPAFAKKTTKQNKKAKKKRVAVERPDVIFRNLQTSIIPVRYLPGNQLIRLLKSFVPVHMDRYVSFRYSPELHKLMIQAPAAVLVKLKKAARQLDILPPQFVLHLYIVENSTKKHGEESEFLDVYKGIRAQYPLRRHFRVRHYLYRRLSNHHRATLKVAGHTTFDPLFRVRVDQSDRTSSTVSLKVQVFHHEKFSSASSHGTNVQFISSIQIDTRVFTKLGQYTLLGDTLLKGVGGAGEQFLLVARVTPAPSGVVVSRVNQTVPVAGSWGKNVIRRVIRGNVKRFKFCYERQLIAHPKLKGRVVMSFSIGKQGHVHDPKVASSTLKNQKVETCLQKAFSTLRFPQPPAGRSVKVRYPLTFHP